MPRINQTTRLPPLPRSWPNMDRAKAIISLRSPEVVGAGLSVFVFVGSTEVVRVRGSLHPLRLLRSLSFAGGDCRVGRDLGSQGRSELRSRRLGAGKRALAGRGVDVYFSTVASLAMPRASLRPPANAPDPPRTACSSTGYTACSPTTWPSTSGPPRP